MVENTSRGKRHEMKHTREQVCVAVWKNDASVQPVRTSIHTGISSIADGLVWYEFADSHQVFWASLDKEGQLWISE